MQSLRLSSGYDMPTVGLGTWQVNQRHPGDKILLNFFKSTLKNYLSFNEYFVIQT